MAEIEICHQCWAVHWEADESCFGLQSCSRKKVGILRTFTLTKH